MGEICDGMKTMQGKLSYFGFDSSPAKSTAGDGLRDRNNELFQDFYFTLLDHFSSVLSVSRIKDVSFDKLFIFDSTTIRLFSDIMGGFWRSYGFSSWRKGRLS